MHPPLDPIDRHFLEEYLRKTGITDPKEFASTMRDCEFLAQVKGTTSPPELVAHLKKWKDPGTGEMLAKILREDVDSVRYWFREVDGRELPLGPADPRLREYFHAVHPDVDVDCMTAPEIADFLRKKCQASELFHETPLGKWLDSEWSKVSAVRHWWGKLDDRPYSLEVLRDYLYTRHQKTHAEFGKMTQTQVAEILKRDYEEEAPTKPAAKPPAAAPAPEAAGMLPAGIVEGRTAESNEPEIVPAKLAASDLARYVFGPTVDAATIKAVDTFLRRYAKKYVDCYEVTEAPTKNEARVLYRTAAVLPHLKEWAQKREMTDG